jgi:hypothetical protein
LKSILNRYGKGFEMLGLVVGYSGDALSDVYRVADLVAIRLTSKHLEYVRKEVFRSTAGRSKARYLRKHKK